MTQTRKKPSSKTNSKKKTNQKKKTNSKRPQNLKQQKTAKKSANSKKGNKHFSWTWKKTLVAVLLLLLGYIIVGMCLPFWRHPEINPFYKSGFSVENFYSDGVFVDRAAILETSKEALDERIRLISKAKHSLILSTFDMRQGSSMDDLAAVLLEAADRGVSVQILVDGISGRLRMEGNQPFDLLAAHPNIEIKLYNRPNLLLPWTYHGRMHDKYMIADDIGYILGGRNTFDYFLGDYPSDGKSLDREVFIYNTAHGKENSVESSVTQIKNYFERVWKSEDCSTLSSRDPEQKKETSQQKSRQLQEHLAAMKEEWPELFMEDSHFEDITLPTHQVTLISGDIGIGGKSPLVWFQMQKLMESATDRVILQTPYAVCSSEMLDGLRRLASGSVDCKLLLNARENGDNVVASSDYTWKKSSIRKTGIPIYEYAGGTSSHGKSVLIDHRMTLIGSYNLDLRSTYVDTELMLAIDSEELNQQLEGYLLPMIADSWLVQADGSYEKPEHLTLEEAGFGKEIFWRTLGFVLKPFRILL